MRSCQMQTQLDIAHDETIKRGEGPTYSWAGLSDSLLTRLKLKQSKAFNMDGGLDLTSQQSPHHSSSAPPFAALAA